MTKATPRSLTSNRHQGVEEELLQEDTHEEKSVLALLQRRLTELSIKLEEEQYKRNEVTEKFHEAEKKLAHAYQKCQFKEEQHDYLLKKCSDLQQHIDNLILTDALRDENLKLKSTLHQLEHEKEDLQNHATLEREEQAAREHVTEKRISEMSEELLELRDENCKLKEALEAFQRVAYDSQKCTQENDGERAIATVEKTVDFPQRLPTMSTADEIESLKTKTTLGMQKVKTLYRKTSDEMRKRFEEHCSEKKNEIKPSPSPTKSRGAKVSNVSIWQKILENKIKELKNAQLQAESLRTNKREKKFPAVRQNTERSHTNGDRESFTKAKYEVEEFPPFLAPMECTCAPDTGNYKNSYKVHNVKSVRCQGFEDCPMTTSRFTVQKSTSTIIEKPPLAKHITPLSWDRTTSL